MNSTSHNSSSSQSPRSRRRSVRGTATVELALCLPMIVLVVFGAVEGASMIFLKQTLVQSSYEGIKVAVKPKCHQRRRHCSDGKRVGRAVTQFGSRRIESVQCCLGQPWRSDHGRGVCSQ
ncbi:MAG: TadE family protein [Pirellulaceae bacterium]